MKISIDNFISTLPISLYGILGIFFVIVIVYLSTVGLCKLCNRDK